MKHLVMISDHLATGGMPALIALEAKCRPDTKITLFVQNDRGYSVQGEQLKKCENVEIISERSPAELLDETMKCEPDLVVQHDTTYGLPGLADKRFPLLRFVHSTYGNVQRLVCPGTDGYLCTSRLVKGALTPHIGETPCEVVRTACDEEVFNPTLYSQAECRYRLLGLPEFPFVIIHVGVWSSHKNQSKMLHIFDKLNIDYRLILVGGQYDNFREYWEPLSQEYKNRGDIYIVGETDRIAEYYAMADIFISTSLEEGCPVAVREAALMGLPCAVSSIPAHFECFKGSPFYFCDSQDDYLYAISDTECQMNDWGENCREWVLKNYGQAAYLEQLDAIYEKMQMGALEKYFTSVTTNVSESTQADFLHDSAQALKRWASRDVDANLHWTIQYRGSVKLLVKAKRRTEVGFRVLGEGQYWENQVIAEPDVEMFIELPGLPWFVPYRCQILENGMILAEEILNLEDEDVKIVFDSTSLGDTLAWLPIALSFGERHKCRIHLETHYNEFFKQAVNRSETQTPFFSTFKDEKYEYVFRVGCYDQAKRPWRSLALWEVAEDCLGMSNWTHKRVEFQITGKAPHPKPYFCVSEYASTKAKMWQYSHGWQYLVNHIKRAGFEVAVISKEATQLEGVLDWTGEQELMERANQLKHSIGFIGLSSGLAWLANALDVPVYMLKGCTHDWHEFQNNVVHIGRTDVCRGCWNRLEFPLDKTHDWCPAKLDFQCSRYLNPDYVWEIIKGYYG